MNLMIVALNMLSEAILINSESLLFAKLKGYKNEFLILFLVAIQ